METTASPEFDPLLAGPAPPLGQSPATPRGLALGVLGFAALGVSSALGAEAGDMTRVAPSALITGVGALALTSPALLVGHQFANLEAPVSSLANALGRSFEVSGGIALGLTPLVLFFAATSGIAPGVLALSMAGIAVAGLAHAFQGLRECERAVGSMEGRLVRDGKMSTLIAIWMALTCAIGLRIAVRFVVGV